MTTQSEIAAHLDLSQSAVSQMLFAGTLPKPVCRGGLDMDACRIAYIQHLREIAAGRAGLTIGLDLVSERARLAKEQADAQAMKNDITRGSVVEIAEAARKVNRDYAAVRSRLLAIPSEHAPQLHRCKTVPLLQAALDAVLWEALNELSTEALATP